MKNATNERVANEILMMLQVVRKQHREVSLYEPIGTDREGNEIQLFDVIESDEEDAPSKVALKDDIKMLYEKVSSELSPRERLVLKMRYGLYEGEEYTQREIARQLGISRSYVSRIEKSAIEKLRTPFFLKVRSFFLLFFLSSQDIILIHRNSQVYIKHLFWVWSALLFLSVLPSNGLLPSLPHCPRLASSLRFSLLRKAYFSSVQCGMCLPVLLL